MKTDQGIWSLDGMDLLDAAATVRTRAEEEAQRSRLGTRSLDALAFVASRETTTPKDLAAHLGIDHQVTGKLLGRLADTDHIAKSQRGVYQTGGKSDQSGKTAGHPSSGIFPDTPLFPPPANEGTVTATGLCIVCLQPAATAGLCPDCRNIAKLWLELPKPEEAPDD